MALRFTSLKTSMFLLIYLAILIPLLVLSVIAINVFESKITSIEEEHLMRNARIIEMTYESHQNDLLKAGLILSKNPDFTSHSSHEAMKFHLANLLHIEELDIASVVDMEGMTVASATTEEVGFMHEFEGLLLNSIQNGIPMVSTEVIKSNELVFENSDLLLDTETRRIPTLYQRENDVEEHIENGLGIVAVIPVFHNHTVKYSIVLVDVLNRDYKFPDKIKETTGLDLSIFQSDVRISTTSLTQKGNRFVGTLLPKSVAYKTLLLGEMYVGRVWVINHWANAVYLPLKNFKGHIIGAIGFESPEENLREAKFLLATGDIQQIILYATILIVLASIMVTYIIANKLTKPLHELSKSMQEVNQGNLEQGVKIKSYDEINELAKTFNIMVRYLRKQIIKREQEIIKEYQEKTKRKKGN